MTKNDSSRSEYDQILEFISSLQNDEASETEELYLQCKELEHQIRQQELVFKEQEKRRKPNIRMFSPLDTESVFEPALEEKDQVEKWKQELVELNQKAADKRNKMETIQRLTNFFSKASDNCISEQETAKNSYCSEDYSLKLLETQELDRNRIARDLHDSTVQSMTGLIHKVELTMKLMDIDMVRAKLELESMKEVIKASIEDMREVIYDLRPMALNNLGLSAAIESLSTHIRKTHDINFELTVEGEEIQVPSIVRVTLYRIVQEACNNIVKHAGATVIKINLDYNIKDIKITIQDNGKGFEEKDTENEFEDTDNHRFGLSTMRERAHLLKGTLDIESKINKGSVIKVYIPLTEYNQEEYTNGKTY